MSALSSFISGYKPGRKTNLKAAIRSPFARRRFEPTSSAPHPFAAPDVIDINHDTPTERRTSSLDFCDAGIPSPDAEGRLVYSKNDTFPPVKLELDLSPEPLGDWFSTSFPETPVPSGSGLQRSNGGSLSAEGMRTTEPNGRLKDVVTEEDEDDEGIELASSAEDVIANLEAMDASSFGKLSKWEETQPASPSKRSPPTPLKIPAHAASHVANLHVLRLNDASLHGPSRPMSEISSPPSSAVSGTTLARQLMGNGFVLSNDTRSSRYRSGYSGLTRSDSTTLPRGEHTFSKDESFSLGPDAPPIPANAESTYVPPKTPRNSDSRGEKRKVCLKRRSSTGSLYSRSQSDYGELPASPPLPRSSSVLVSPGLEMELGLVYERSPLPELPLFLPKDEGEPIHDQPKSNSHIVNVEEPKVIRPDSSIMSPESSYLSPPLSPEGEPPSSKNLDDVLDYYSLPENNGVDARSFKPVFTPITEESLSQLSPPLPYRNDRRDSQRGPPVGARSPNTSRARGLPRRPSDPRPTFRSSTLPPVGERPHSVQISSSSPSAGDSRSTHRSQNSVSSTSSIASDLRAPFAPLAPLPPLSPLAPPPLSKIFGRQRSGSAPGPISVIRDLSAYKIAVAPRSHSPGPVTEEYVNVPQTFPVPPDGFSPAWLPPASGASHVPNNTNEDASQSAFIPGRSNVVPSLAQQILVTRAGSNARHSRQTSLSRSQGSGSDPHARPSSSLITEPSESLREDLPSRNGLSSRNGSVDKLPAPKRSLPPSPDSHNLRALTPLSDSSVSLVTPASENHMSRSPSYTSNDSHSQGNLSNGTSGSQDDASSNSRMKSLPLILPSPRNTTPLPEDALEESVASSSRGRVPPALLLSPQRTPSRSELAEVLSDLESPEPVGAIFPVITPPMALQYPARRPSGRGEVPSLGAPPPYYSVYDNRSQDLPPNSGNSGVGPKEFSFGGQPHPLGQSHNPWRSSNSSDGHHLARDSSIGSRRTRMRPPLPAGPRRPSQTPAGFSPFAMSFAANRDRSGSVTSIGSNSAFSGGRRHQLSQRSAASVFSPKFQTPPPKYRGLTMEHAKWTFTSEELQAIVSRAIQQSAEASSIRLLRLENLDTDIPKEMRRLEIHKTEVKNQYKILTRRRASLLESLTMYLGGREQDDANFALSVVEEVKDIDVTLDKLAEELHASDQQMAHLESLCQVHSASALSMALRKLNSSFLKQVAENQVLQTKIETLTAERDEAWKQAEAVANDFDHLNDQPTSPSSKRSSRVSAVRKSSVRVSKAGLRSSSQRLSQRSSTGSVLSSALSTSRSPMYRQSIPPVPPIPNRRPSGILTDIPLKSPTPLSADGITPDTGIRALVQAQDDLYNMLGISFTEHGFRRSRSATGLRGDFESVASARPRSRVQPPVSAGRRSSFPGESALAEAHNALDADRNAMLATFELLSD